MKPLLPARLVCLILLVVSPLALAAPRTSPATKPTTAPSGIRTIILIRHGAYDEKDAPHGLTRDGQEQARLTGRRLADLPRKPDEIFMSPLPRAKETAEIICKELNVAEPVIDEDLMEGGPPVTPLSTTGPTTKPTRPPTDGEIEFRDRIDKVFDRYFRPRPGRNTLVVLVCHGNVIRWLWSRSLEIDPGIWPRYQISNCNVTEIRIRPDGSRINVSYNDVGHLPPNLRSFSWRSPMYRPEQ